MKNFKLFFVTLLIVQVSVAKADGEIERALEKLLRGEIAATQSAFLQGPSKEGREATPGKYAVKSGDTLDRVIYKTFRGSKIRKAIIRDAYVKANPGAFRRGNPNWLYAGAELHLPNKHDFLNVFFVEDKGTRRKSPRKGNWVTFP